MLAVRGLPATPAPLLTRCRAAVPALTPTHPSYPSPPRRLAKQKLATEAAHQGMLAAQGRMASTEEELGATVDGLRAELAESRAAVEQLTAALEKEQRALKKAKSKARKSEALAFDPSEWSVDWSDALITCSL